MQGVFMGHLIFYNKKQIRDKPRNTNYLEKIMRYRLFL